MSKVCRLFTIASLVLGVACMGKTQSSSNESETVVEESVVGVQLSEREERLYANTLRKVEAAELALKNIESGEESVTKVLNDVRKLHYPYNDKYMNSETREYCEALQYRIDTLKEYAKQLSSDGVAVGNATRMVGITKSGKPHIVEGVEREPYYLVEGDVLYFDVVAEKNATVNLYNAESYSHLKSRSGREIKDSVKIDFSAIYLVEVVTKERQYVTCDVAIKSGSNSLHRPQITSERIECKKGDFGAMPVEAIKMINIFDQARKFTLRGQIKSTFSGTSRAVVAIKVPTGATDILYSMRISTSEQSRTDDGEFYNNIDRSYKRIDVFNLPVYEKHKSRRNGIIDMILDDNHPICEEDAYCNMYVIRNPNQAKKFQDGSISLSQIEYDVDYSMLGTQSCNGSIPVNGSKTIYIAFENERMRYANYLWVEAVAVVPTTEYFTTKYSVQ